MISWGKQNGKRRFKCKNCGIYFTSENKSVGLKNKEIWFKKWIVGKQTYEQISAESGYSVSTLQRYFNPNSAIEKKEYFSILISNCVAVEKNKR